MNNKAVRPDNVEDVYTLLSGAAASGFSGVYVAGVVTKVTVRTPFTGRDGKVVDISGTVVEVRTGDTRDDYVFIKFPKEAPASQVPLIGSFVGALVSDVRRNDAKEVTAMIAHDPVRGCRVAAAEAAGPLHLEAAG